MNTTCPVSQELAPLDFAFFPRLKSNLHGKRLSDLFEQRIESDLKKDMILVISTENRFNDT